MPTVVVYHDFPIAAELRDQREDLVVLAASNDDDVLQNLPEADIFVVNPANWNPAFLDALEATNWVQATSTGYDAFPIDDFADRGISFTNATGNYGPAVSEHTFALALAISRKLPTFFQHQREKEWDRSLGLETTDWKEKTLTVIGLGNIGEAIAKRGKAFGMNVYGVKRDPESYTGRLSADHVVAEEELYALLPETDLLVAIVPLTDETYHMIDSSVFESLPDSAHLINVSRGEVVDEKALVEALENDEIAGAGLDVFETEPLPQTSPLWERDDVFITPHVAGRSDSFIDRFASLFLENFERWKAHDALKNEIVGQ